MKWELDKHRRDILAREKSLVKISCGACINFALIYPERYFIGMSSLGYQLIYDLLNSIPDVSCERFFFPDSPLHTAERDLFSLETGTPLSNFDIIGFSISFEMDYTRVLRMLSCGGFPVYSSQRQHPFPLIIAGGAFSFFNPEPLASFFDVIILGEAEETLPELINVVMNNRSTKDKGKLLEELGKAAGIYIPHFYSTGYGSKISPQPPRKQWIKNLDNFRGSSCVVTRDTEFSGMFLVELARGCKNQCGFCMVGHCFKPYRARNFASLKESLETGKTMADFVGLIAPNVSDYSRIDELCTHIRNIGLKLSFSSLRADKISEIMLASLVASGQKTLTLAPETGSDKLRRLCLKGINNDDYFRAVKMALKAGIKNFKFYFMIGLPGETDSDISEILFFITQIRTLTESEPGVKLYLSINQFIPKPGTHFQRFPLEGLNSISEKSKFLKDGVKSFSNVRINIESLKWSIIQAFLALGDRNAGKIIFLVSQYWKENFHNWRKALEESEVDINYYVYRLKEHDEIFPWSYITEGRY